MTSPIELVLQSTYENAFRQCLCTLGQAALNDEMRPASPLLIRPPSSYFQSSLKIMFFGQETNGWGGGFHEDIGIERLLVDYDCWANRNRGFEYGGQFWNAIKSFSMAFTSLEPRSSFIWNNIIKVGKYVRGRPSTNALLWQEPWFGVIRDEVRLLKPDVVIFFTGPNYDDMIRKTFGEFDVSPVNGFNSRKLSRITSSLLPCHTFRTYHPGYLYRVGLSAVRDAIVNEVRANLTTPSASSP